MRASRRDIRWLFLWVLLALQGQHQLVLSFSPVRDLPLPQENCPALCSRQGVRAVMLLERTQTTLLPSEALCLKGIHSSVVSRIFDYTL